MKLALFSDVHANREAFGAFLRDAATRGAEGLVCLGDVVGYGADPAWCVEVAGALAGAWDFGAALTAELGPGAALAGKLIHVVAGNHDRAVLGDPIIDHFNDAGRTAATWTGGVLDLRQRAFLSRLPYTVYEKGRFYVHASPAFPERYIYITDRDDAGAAFAACDASRIFFGHTHFPAAYALRNDRPLLVPYGGFDGERRVLANAGSVGQPRDGDPRGGYVLWDDAADVATLVRFDYDVEKAAGKIIKAGLPHTLARRLAIGR